MRIKRLLTCYRCSNNQIRKLSVLFLLFLCVPSMIFMTVMTNNTDGLAKNIMDFIFKIANEFSPIYIRRYEDPNLNSFNIVKKSSKLCPILSPYLMPGLHMQEIDNVLKSKLSWKEIEDMNPDVELGGHHEPKSCTARRNLAIVIPFRDREDNLKKFSTYIHNFLQRQQLNYTIFVVEQVDDYPFNRGALMNVGFVESRKVNNFTCYAMHDVDLLPENDKNMYICDQRNPVHLSVVMNSDNYWPTYDEYFGGVCLLAVDQLIKMNGFSNVFWGWGGEDDDFYLRLVKAGYKMIRDPPYIGRYTMLKHVLSKRNPRRYTILKQAIKSYKADGINNVKYDLLKTEKRKLYTFIQVRFKGVNATEIL